MANRARVRGSTFSLSDRHRESTISVWQWMDQNDFIFDSATFVSMSSTICAVGDVNGGADATGQS